MKTKIALTLALLLLVLCQRSYGQRVADTTDILHVRNGLPNFFKKIEKHQPVTIGYLGGSITEAAGYRVQTEKYFKEKYPQSNINTINAGVGGTGAALGVFRVQAEVLQYHPDLVFVEFAVNDAETDSLMICNAIEGIVRQIKAADKNTDICFLYTIWEPMLKDLQKGKKVRSVRIMEHVAAYYQLPSINLQYDVVKMLNEGQLVFHGEAGKDYGSKIVFTTDGTHPGTPGHSIYTQTIIAAFEKMNHYGKVTKLPQPLYSTNFQKTAILTPDKFQKTPGWIMAGAEKDLQPYLKAYPGLIYSATAGDSIAIKFKGTYVGVGDILGPPSAGAVLISVDGAKPIVRNRFDSYGWFYRRSFYLVGPLPDAIHTVVIKKDPTAVDKVKMLGGHASAYGPEAFEPANIYIGNIMIIGQKL